MMQRALIFLSINFYSCASDELIMRLRNFNLDTVNVLVNPRAVSSVALDDSTRTCVHHRTRIFGRRAKRVN